jgi:hypothetical protein
MTLLNLIQLRLQLRFARWLMRNATARMERARPRQRRRGLCRR